MVDDEGKLRVDEAQPIHPRCRRSSTWKGDETSLLGIKGKIKANNSGNYMYKVGKRGETTSKSEVST